MHGPYERNCPTSLSHTVPPLPHRPNVPSSPSYSSHPSSLSPSLSRPSRPAPRSWKNSYSSPATTPQASAPARPTLPSRAYRRRGSSLPSRLWRRRWGCCRRLYITSRERSVSVRWGQGRVAAEVESGQGKKREENERLTILTSPRPASRIRPHRTRPITLHTQTHTPTISKVRSRMNE